MRPLTRAGYGAVLLVVLTLGLQVMRVVMELSGVPADPVVTLAANTTLTAAVGALVWLVHVNGEHR